MSKRTRLRQAITLLPVLLVSGWANAALLSPGTSYLSFQDSPFWNDYDSGNFTGTNGYFYLENFEDGSWTDSPGLTVTPVGGTTLQVRGSNSSSMVDSVDADIRGNTTNWQTPATTDGRGSNGTALLTLSPQSSSGVVTQGASFIFNPGGTLSMLPTHVGIVWTDGFIASLNPPPFYLEAFDGLGNSLGVIAKTTAAGSPASPDNSYAGTTGEDRFLGVINTGNGISKITVYSTQGGGIELDHLQYGYLAVPVVSPPPAVPEPSTLMLMALMLLFLAQRRRNQV